MLQRSSIWKKREDGGRRTEDGGLEVVADEDEGRPVERMFEGIGGGRSVEGGADFAGILSGFWGLGCGGFVADRLGVFEGEASGNEVLLDLLDGLGFGFAGLNVLVKLLHEECGGGVVDLPE